MNGKSRNILPTGGPARNRQGPQPHGTRLEVVLVVGAVLLSAGYFAMRHIGPRNVSAESAWPGQSAANSTQPTVVAVKRRAIDPAQAARISQSEPITSFPPLTRPATAPKPAPVEASPQPAGQPTAGQDLVSRLAQPAFFAGGVTMQKADEL